ncbi:MAG: SGNH/GDSL hydrolase family protein [Bifidobacteriaceae bacterium]|jgi:lysophospholipase L1-like esterase|nr:SGNH/GDSL hydrolase family protein [Bifidobacteriaceae bacterium]
MSTHTEITTTDPEPARRIIPHLAKWNTVVTIGDSVDEGLWDSVDPELDLTKLEAQQEYADAPVFGWADRLAAHISRHRAQATPPLPPVDYANIAVRGKLIKYIVETEIPQALALKPDLVIMDGGGNDILRPGTSIDQVIHYFEYGLTQIRATGSDVIILMPSQPGGSLLSLTRAKSADYTARLHSLANRYDCYIVDLWDYPNLVDARLWSQDRIHPTPECHERIAQIALLGLGLPADPAWADGSLRRRLPGALQPLPERVHENAEWFKSYVLPWVDRRLHGVSSGDNRAGKRPVPTPMPASEPHPGSSLLHQGE